MRVIGIVVAVLAVIAVSGLAGARVKLNEACGADLERFCKDIQKGQGRKACLRNHASELQPGCSGALKARDAEKAATHSK